MSKLSILLLLLSFFCLPVLNGQNIWNVNNLTSGVNAHFTTLQAAVDSASAGDIIYLYPSANNYGAATIDKKLIIIGPGYNITDNIDSTGIQTYTTSAKVTNLTLESGSEGSVIMGLDLNSAPGNIELYNASNLLIQRNKIYGIIFMVNSSNVLLNGNYLYSTYNNNSIYDDELYINNDCSTILVANNIFNVQDLGSGDENVFVHSSSTATFKNNIFKDFVNASNCTFKNNIFLNGGVPSTSGNVIEYNVFSSTNPNIPPSNITGVNQDSVFLVPLTALDAEKEFYLNTNSPALGAGEGGIDAGVFSGDTPYKLSGIPFIPLIYEINAPTSGTSGGGLPITIKARAEN
ncbi:MAG: hypothetical protein AAFZ15_06580 [Bacteroidota bacterium]